MVYQPVFLTLRGHCQTLTNMSRVLFNSLILLHDPLLFVDDILLPVRTITSDLSSGQHAFQVVRHVNAHGQIPSGVTGSLLYVMSIMMTVHQIPTRFSNVVMSLVYFVSISLLLGFV